MSRRSNSPVDILGITLGVIVILVVAASVVGLVRSRAWAGGWSFPDRGMFRDWKWDWSDDNRGGSPMREEKDELVPAGSYSEIEVRTIAGSIDIAGSAAGPITVHSTKVSPFPAARDSVRVVLEKQGDRLVVREELEPRRFPRAARVSFRVTVPAGVKVIEARAVSGSIELRDIPAGVDQKLGTISGAITTNRARSLDISTTSGAIEFVSDGPELTAHTISGSISGTLAGLPPGGSARFNTVSGSVNLSAFPALDASLSLHSVSGRVSCAFPVTINEQRNNRLDGKVGKGAAIIDIGTVSGSIDLSKD
jgi:hypothetical protein